MLRFFINELTPPVNGFFTLGCSLPGLWQEEHLQLMKGWKDPSGTVSECLGLSYTKVYFGAFEKRLISS